VEPLVLCYLVLYGLASLLYLAYLFHQQRAPGRNRPLVGLGPASARAGRYVLMAAWAVHLVDIGLRCFRMQHPLSSIGEAMAFIAWLIATGFLVSTFRYRLHAAGAFAIPVVLVLLLLARIGPDEQPQAPLGSPLATVHILLATVGVATFALAAVLAIVYLLQERRLKSKRFDLKVDSAPLDTLDRLAGACVSFGFPVFTLTIVTGAAWIAKLGLLRTGTAVRPEYLLTVIAWAVLGGLLLARLATGWRGRRAAWLTVGGFSAAALVLVGYFIRHTA
jgi:ABC-type uncharacterized transport system permease subunit